jgi:hypothetical protein
MADMGTLPWSAVASIFGVTHYLVTISMCANCADCHDAPCRMCGVRDVFLTPVLFLLPLFERNDVVPTPVVFLLLFCNSFLWGSVFATAVNWWCGNPVRFSLRTLLIAMTFVAVVLGLLAF